jgi:DNA polymerase-3 subunit gamma/tau
MEKFIVSARKYRPQTFDTVVGQSHITTTLKNAIKSQHLAHAFLFCGPRGVGKTTCARILAKTINCLHATPEGEACNECTSCVSFNEGSSLNIHELDAASNNSVEDIRTLVEQVRFAPQAGKYKVYIIDEVHMLSSSAFNAFLKTLEEPPSYAIFILATTEKHKILPTILSRCQIFDFKRITNNDTVEHLQEICVKEEVNAEKPALQIIAQKSEGCMRDALSIMDKIVSFTGGVLNYQNTLEHLNILDAEYYFKILGAMQAQDLGTVLSLYDDIDKKGFEGDLVLNGYAEFIRNLLVCKDEKVAHLLTVVESFKDKYIESAKSVSASYLISALNILNEAELQFKAARNKRLHVELTLIKLTYLQQAISLAAEDADPAKKKLVDQARPVAFKNIPGIQSVKKEKPAVAKETAVPVQPAKQSEPVQAPVASAPTIRTTMPATTMVAPPPAATTATVSAKLPKLNSLNKIRAEVAHQNTGKVVYSAIDLSEESLRVCWEDYTQLLRDEKSSAASPFTLAERRIIDHETFEVWVTDNVQKQFVEHERRRLSEYIQGRFHNRQIKYSVHLDPNAVSAVSDVVIPPTTKEQYIAIAEQYPLVNELRERLNLGLDY